MTISIYDVSTAQQTILQRRVTPTHVSPALQTRLEELFGIGTTPASAVAHILADVQARGDAALHDYTRRIEGIPSLAHLQIPPDQVALAPSILDSNLRDAIAFAADRIRRFHLQQPIASWQTESMGGIVGQRVVPLRRVGIYVPGGTAPLPSSLLMAAIPAQVAGVKDIVICTPPSRATGTVNPVILATAALLGIQKVYALGGAQAIAALAFGTESIAPVDKIVGPGNLFVTLAKQQVYGRVGLDGLAGPTETLVIADESANPQWVAADLLAQAEHDALATALLLTPSASLAEQVQRAVTEQMATLPRREIIEASLRQQSGIVLTPNLEVAVALANDYAPEHLCLSVANPEQWIPRIHNAGGIFVGEYSCEVLGDYVAGPSHIMPTGGTARFASPVNVLDFVKIISLFQLDEETARSLSRVAGILARAEGLDAHAGAADYRG